MRKLKEKAVAKGVWSGHGVRAGSRKKKVSSKYDSYSAEDSVDDDDLGNLLWESSVEVRQQALFF